MARENTSWLIYLMKAFPTNFTHERFVASMDSHMSVEGGAAVECLLTYCAFVRLLVGVNYFVATQGASLTETFVAYLKERKNRSQSQYSPILTVPTCLNIQMFANSLCTDGFVSTDKFSCLSKPSVPSFVSR